MLIARKTDIISLHVSYILLCTSCISPAGIGDRRIVFIPPGIYLYVSKKGKGDREVLVMWLGNDRKWRLLETYDIDHVSDMDYTPMDFI